MRSCLKGVLTKVVVLMVLAASYVSAPAQSAADYQKIMQDKSPAIVTIKFLLKVKARGKETESQAEATGVMIDPKGLILCSNTRLGGVGAYLRSIGRDITTSPTELKVLIGDDTDGLDARVVTRDTELDLAWVQIKDPGERKFAWIDLADSVEGQIGEPVIAVRRMSKVFDRVAVISESRIAGVAKKPRRLYVPVSTLPLSEAIGLPVFAPNGKLLGVALLQGLNDEDQDQSSDRSSRAEAMRELVSGLILPASEVVEATRQAKLTAATQPAEETQPASSEPAASPSKVPPKDKIDAPAKPKDEE